MTATSSASLRIMGRFDPELISGKLGMSPSFVIFRGDKDILGHPYRSDMWSLNSPLNSSTTLDKHLKWMAKTVKARYQVLRDIKKDKNRIDIFCSVTFIGENGFPLKHEDLDIFCDLGINIEVSLISLSGK